MVYLGRGENFHISAKECSIIEHLRWGLVDGEHIPDSALLNGSHGNGAGNDRTGKLLAVEDGDGDIDKAWGTDKYIGLSKTVCPGCSKVQCVWTEAGFCLGLIKVPADFFILKVGAQRMGVLVI